MQLLTLEIMQQRGLYSNFLIKRTAGTTEIALMPLFHHYFMIKVIGRIYREYCNYLDITMKSLYLNRKPTSLQGSRQFTNTKSKIVLTCLKKQDIQQRYEALKEESEAIRTELTGLSKTPEIHDWVVSLLGSGPRLSEETQRQVDHPTVICSKEDGQEKVIPVDVSSRYFDPGTDEWEIVSIEEGPESTYRLQIEAVKNRKYIGAFTYTMDTFWSPWFKLGGNTNEEN